MTNKTFCGVFPSDKLPQTIKTYPCGYFLSKEEGEFFDSYGYPPNHYKSSFKNFLDKHSYDWNFNDRKLQSNWSDVCSHYCIFYLSHRARGFSMNKNVQLFGNDSMLNDTNIRVNIHKTI